MFSLRGLIITARHFTCTGPRFDDAENESDEENFGVAAFDWQMVAGIHNKVLLYLYLLLMYFFSSLYLVNINPLSEGIRGNG